MEHQFLNHLIVYQEVYLLHAAPLLKLVLLFLYSGLRKNVAKVISLRQITNIINSNVLKKDKYHDNGEDRWTIPWNLIDSEEIEIFTPEEIAKFERIGALYKKLENETQPQLSM